jgi:hypothetical protein
MADDVEKIISLVHRIYGERGLDVLDGVSGGEKTPRDDINEWRAKADSLLVSADVLQYGEPEEPEEPETIQDPKVQEVEQSCWTCAHDRLDDGAIAHWCNAENPLDPRIGDYVADSGAIGSDDLMPTDRTLKCPRWKQKSVPTGSVEGP